MPGVTLNLSKRGVSVSAGPQGAKFTAGTSGMRATAGVPGTGLFYTKKIGGRGRGGGRRGAGGGGGGGRLTAAERREHAAAAEQAAALERLDLGFLERLRTPADERWFVDAAAAFVRGDREAAYQHAAKADRGADAAWLAGTLAMDRGDQAAAMRHFGEAWRRRATLGQLFERYGVGAVMDLAVTGDVRARVTADERGLLLVRAELAQAAGDEQAAVDLVRLLLERMPEDPVVRLSLAELLIGDRFDELVGDPDRPLPAEPRLSARRRAVLEEVVGLAAGIENETAVHTALLHFSAVALASLGLLDAARERLTLVLRRTAGRPEELLRDARLLRAVIHEADGRRAAARKDLERLYAEDPRFPTVARRLGLRG